MHPVSAAICYNGERKKIGNEIFHSLKKYKNGIQSIRLNFPSKNLEPEKQLNTSDFSAVDLMYLTVLCPRLCCNLV
jgi:hypothetical protein